MRRVTEVVVWSALLLGVWVLTLSSVSTPELAVASACAVLAAVATLGARVVSGGSWAPSPGWARWLVALPVAIVADTARIFGLALAQLAHGRRREPGDIRPVPIGDRGDDARAAAHRALSTLCVTSTPGSFVVDARPDDGKLLVHTLVEGAPSIAKVVSR
ncbi:MAG TPA: Na+/H+ antiporter subunit E [Acidimicrobiia bacterium]|nr:Na+/H+ antiporter subunit E [Acidimicrobiia bacterium]